MKFHNKVSLYVGILLIFNLGWVFGVNKDTLYTPEEKEGLKQIKFAISNITYTDYQKFDSYLIHFLRREKLNVAKTLKLLAENYNWRKTNNVDSILQEKKMINLEKSFPITTDGFDKDGRPTLTYTLQRWDIRRVILSGRGDDFRRYQIYILEKIKKRVHTLTLDGKDVSQFNILIDFSGFNTRQHACLLCLQALSDFVPLLDAHYPDAANNIIFINAPRAFDAVLNLIKSFLDPTRRGHFHVFGYDKTEWRQFIEQRYDNDQISSEFGGTRVRRLTN